MQTNASAGLSGAGTTPSAPTQGGGAGKPAGPATGGAGSVFASTAAAGTPSAPTASAASPSAGTTADSAAPAANGGASGTGGMASVAGRSGASAVPMTAGAGGVAADSGVRFPPVTDFAGPGPYKSMTMSGSGPGGGYTVYRPDVLAPEGAKKPIVGWMSLAFGQVGRASSLAAPAKLAAGAPLVAARQSYLRTRWETRRSARTRRTTTS